MEVLTSVLTTLKVDNTIWIQLGCFLVAYFSLSNLIFKPYYKVFVARQERTVGGEENAEKLEKETEALTEKFELRTREINTEFKEIYDSEKVQATKSYNDRVAKAREDAQSEADSVRGKIAGEVQKAQSELDGELPAVSSAMASKLVGKDVTI